MEQKGMEEEEEEEQKCEAINNMWEVCSDKQRETDV